MKTKGPGWSEYGTGQGRQAIGSPATSSRTFRCGATRTNPIRRSWPRRSQPPPITASDAFIFDWYYYDDGPFLERPIDEGFLKAENNSRIKFAFMWANHDWLEIHPYHRGSEREVLYPGKVTPETFDKIADHVIRDYFTHPSYWRIDGRPYFSFYDLTKLLENLGSVEATRAGGWSVFGPRRLRPACPGCT